MYFRSPFYSLKPYFYQHPTYHVIFLGGNLANSTPINSATCVTLKSNTMSRSWESLSLQFRISKDLFLDKVQEVYFDTSIEGCESSSEQHSINLIF